MMSQTRQQRTWEDVRREVGLLLWFTLITNNEWMEMSRLNDRPLIQHKSTFQWLDRSIIETNLQTNLEINKQANKKSDK